MIDLVVTLFCLTGVILGELSTEYSTVTKIVTTTSTSIETQTSTITSCATTFLATLHGGVSTEVGGFKLQSTDFCLPTSSSGYISSETEPLSETEYKWWCVYLYARKLLVRPMALLSTTFIMFRSLILEKPNERAVDM